MKRKYRVSERVLGRNRVAGLNEELNGDNLVKDFLDKMEPMPSDKELEESGFGESLSRQLGVLGEAVEKRKKVYAELVRFQKSSGGRFLGLMSRLMELDGRLMVNRASLDDLKGELALANDPSVRVRLEKLVNDREKIVLEQERLLMKYYDMTLKYDFKKKEQSLGEAVAEKVHGLRVKDV